MAITLKIDDARVRYLLETQFPKETASSLRRAFSGIASNFTTQISKQRLKPGIYNVRRKAKKGTPKGGGRMRINKRAQAAGFKATLKPPGEARIGKLQFEVRTSNPLLTSREFGRSQTPKRGQYLYARIYVPREKTKTGKTRKARAARNLSPAEKKRAAAGFGPYRLERRKIRSVSHGANLGVRALWASYQGEAIRRLNGGLADAARRIDLRLGRRARRAG